MNEAEYKIFDVLQLFIFLCENDSHIERLMAGVCGLCWCSDSRHFRAPTYENVCLFQSWNQENRTRAYQTIYCIL